MYLCKNGVGIKMEVLTGPKETVFKLVDVGKNDSGNYSCVYSIPRHSLDDVTGVGEKSIFIHVKDFGQANTFIRNSIVSEGGHVDMKCAAFETKTQKTLKMYLCKNGIGVSIQNEVSSEAHFTLTQVRREDSGNYSCVYSIKKHPTDSVRCTNEHSVTLQVTENSSTKLTSLIPIPVILLCGVGATVMLCRKSFRKCE
ncbi:hypothetical protein ACEWY4_026912 [Coilia grayii]|uniref:Ig-like domain-containing protein n=1 Tax=Coilia grayii TaxID=363190 RepID=A0ABD1IQY0_9TELE